MAEEGVTEGAKGADPEYDRRLRVITALQDLGVNINPSASTEALERVLEAHMEPIPPEPSAPMQSDPPTPWQKKGGGAVKKKKKASSSYMGGGKVYRGRKYASGGRVAKYNG